MKMIINMINKYLQLLYNRRTLAIYINILFFIKVLKSYLKKNIIISAKFERQ